jgi:hypothetical protein
MASVVVFRIENCTSCLLFLTIVSRSNLPRAKVKFTNKINLVSIRLCAGDFEMLIKGLVVYSILKKLKGEEGFSQLYRHLRKRSIPKDRK